MIDVGPYWSGLRSIAIAGGSVAVTLGVISASDAQGIATNLNDISEGVKLIMKGGGGLLLIVTPIIGVWKARLTSKVADVKEAAPAQLAQAMTKVAPAEMVIAVKDMPEVKGVVTTDTLAGQKLAASIPSAAVAAAGTADAKIIAAPAA